jgi:hypothetical protein
VGDIFRSIRGSGETRFIKHHHCVLADRMDRRSGQDLVAPTSQKPPLVKGQADQATCLGVVDNVTHLSDVLPASDRDNRKSPDLRSSHEQPHRLPRVAMTPPFRRRRRAITKTAATTETTITTTISQVMAPIAQS